MVSTHPFFSKSFSPCTNLLVTALIALIIIDITVIFMFYIFFFNSLARSWYLNFMSLSLNYTLTLWSTEPAKFTIRQVHFCGCCCCCCCCCWLIQGLNVCPRSDDLFVSQNPSDVCASPVQILGCAFVRMV